MPAVGSESESVYSTVCHLIKKSNKKKDEFVSPLCELQNFVRINYFIFWNYSLSTKVEESLKLLNKLFLTAEEKIGCGGEVYSWREDNYFDLKKLWNELIVVDDDEWKFASEWKFWLWNILDSKEVLRRKFVVEKEITFLVSEKILRCDQLLFDVSEKSLWARKIREPKVCANLKLPKLFLALNRSSEVQKFSWTFRVFQSRQHEHFCSFVVWIK